MTSERRQFGRPCEVRGYRGPAGWQGCRRSQARSGFTLVELLLVVALILMLVGALVFNFSNLMRGNPLAEGTTQLETLMRFARAHAANSGRKVQLVFNGEPTNALAASTGEVRATWEPDPLRQPGSFMDLAETFWHVQQINDLVHVESVKLLDSSTACPPPIVGEEENESSDGLPAKAFAPITFYPDGSSDSAEIIVAARSFEEDQRMAVRLVGITGSISHQLLSADLLDTAGDLESPERIGQPFRESGARPSVIERETPSPLQNSRSSDSSPPPISATPRATVGETNSVDLID